MVLRVLIRNLLSKEKKKNEPLLPQPWPALKTIDLFDSSEREYFISSGEMPSRSKIYANFSSQCEIMFDFTEIISPSLLEALSD